MSDLSSKEKLILEKFLGMGTGYVLNFSNRTFEEFILENTGISIYDEKYNYASGSKANRLRALWDKETNYLVGKLINAVIEYRKTSVLLNYSKIDENEEKIIQECLKISERLFKDVPVSSVEELTVNAHSSEFSLLANSIMDCIEKNQPQVGLDRLHTYLIKFLRQLCERYNVTTNRNTPLHSLLGTYIKCLDRTSLMESEMSKRILKSSISVLESFNDVRNERSYFHYNSILNHNESILIFNNIINLIKFINSIENRVKELEKKEIVFDDVPF